MRSIALATALALAPAAALAAGVIEVPAANGVQLEYAYEISGDGLVLVGDCTAGGRWRSCRWSEAGGHQVLEELAGEQGTLALAASRDGSVVVGSASLAGDTYAVLWRADGKVTDLGIRGAATGVSADGSVVVGWTGASLEEHRAFRWTQAGGFELASEGTAAEDVSADGRTVVGCCIRQGHAHWAPRPFVWEPGAAPTALERVHPGGDQVSGVSPNGRVAVGGLNNPGGVGFALRWTRGAAGLVARPSPEVWNPHAYDASADGSVIVGMDGTFGRGFLWDASRGMRFVQDVLAASGVAVGWEIGSTRAVSEDGRRISGIGYHDGSWSTVIVVLGPACDDGLDNDGDGKTDLADPHCAGPSGESEAEASGAGLGVVFLLAPIALLRRRRAPWAVLASLAAVLPTVAGAAALLAIEPVGGVSLVNMDALSGDGRVLAGTCHRESPERRGPCRWRPGSGAEWLDAPASGFVQVRDASHDGSVTIGNRSQGSSERAVWWESSGRIEDLPEAPLQVWSQALTVSSDGSVALGRVRIGIETPIGVAYVWRACRWTLGEGIEVLPLESNSSVASADAGVFVETDGHSDYFVWSEGAEPVSLPRFEGSFFYPTQVSRDGASVVGTEDRWPGARALRWTAGAGTALLGPLAYPFFLQPYPRDLSADGSIVVGGDEVAGAFVWDEAGGMRRLGEMLALEHRVDVGAWDFLDALEVSDDGRIVAGIGYQNGVSKYVLANLAPACDDGVDNDADGGIDLADGDCRSPNGRTERAIRSCGVGFEIALALPLLAALRRRKRR